MDPWMFGCAVFCVAFAVFHMLFWKILGWRAELSKLSATTRAVIQVLNLRLIYVFLAVAVICLAYPQEMRTTKVGRALLIGMACFWAGRLTEQFIFFRREQRFYLTLCILFFAGTILFLAPAIL